MFHRYLISIHALREEGDLLHKKGSHTPAGISIHALREEGDAELHTFDFWKKISIHALREEGDREGPAPHRSAAISIHALREEGDSKNRDKISIFKQIIQHSARI